MSVSIKKLNTFGVDVQASEVIEIDSIASLRAFFASKPALWRVLGEGSNILFTREFDGTIVLLKMDSVVELTEETTLDTMCLRVEAGLSWDDLCDYCCLSGLWGVENLSGIPGSVGAAPVQNIGAYGAEASNVIRRVNYLDTHDLELKSIGVDDCDFGYRSSVFKRELFGRAVIVSVDFALQRNPLVNLSYGALAEHVASKGEVTLQNIRASVLEIRDSKLPDPKVLGNGGSFFKNPVVNASQFESLIAQYPAMPHYKVGDSYKIPAAYLIESAGWKGRRVGDAGVHTNQALVLVNYGSATGAEVFALSEMIIRDVESKFSIVL
ncbi:MAG: UDP-N-acetylmuramate dehydrogenase, partial [Rikenellaceae bacterium]